MEIKRIGVLSAAKVSGVLYGALGLIAGAIFAAMSLLGSFHQSADDGFNMIFGVGGIVALPILYGLMGCLGGLVCAALYNLIARCVGGLELDFGNGAMRHFPEAEHRAESSGAGDDQYVR